jgi:hypothetical protein
MSRILAASALLLFASGCPAPNQKSEGPRSPEELASRIRTAVEAGEPEALVSLIQPVGLTCGDSLTPPSKIRSDMRQKKAYFPGFFDSELLRERQGNHEAVSFREFFKRHPDAAPFIGGDAICWYWGDCAPHSYLWRIFFIKDATGRLWISEIGC